MPFELTTIDAIDSMEADDVLSNLIENQLRMKQCQAAKAALLDRLDRLAEQGKVDYGGFTFNDWSFSYCSGRSKWSYPGNLTQMEQSLKELQRRAQADGTATQTKSDPSWTINPPKQ